MTTAPLTDTELAELREKAEKATPGEWARAGQYQIHSPEDRRVAGATERHDAAFIAAFNPQTALRLLSDLAHARKRVTVLEWVICEDLSPDETTDDANEMIVREIHERLGE